MQGEGMGYPQAQSMPSRPHTPVNRPPPTRSAAAAWSGGVNLGPLIAEAEALRVALGYARFSSLKPWTDDGQPLTTDGEGLELLIERLCIVWVNRGNG